MIKRSFVPFLSVFLSAAALAVELTDEQRAAIAERIAPVGDVCLQGENCGGLPSTQSAQSGSMAAAPAPSASSASSGGSAAADGAEAASGGADAASDADAGAMAVADAGGASSIDGEAIYNQACMACHASGAGGAPMVGDVDAWAPRIAKGMDALHNSGVNGVAGTAMMAKGGRMDLSDDEVKAAVDYMVAASE